MRYIIHKRTQKGPFLSSRRNNLSWSLILSSDSDIPGEEDTKMEGFLPVVPQGSGYPLPNPVLVVGQQFLAPYPVELVISKKLFKFGEGHFSVADANGNPVFTVRGKLISLRDRRTLLDAYGNTLLSLQKKILTAHRRWQVYRGDSTSSRDLLFSAKKSSLIQFKTELDVFLSANTSESVCDFKVKRSWLENSCTMYYGDSNIVIGQMHKKQDIQSIVFAKDTFAVTAYPNVDYAFIVALVVILQEISEDGND